MPRGAVRHEPDQRGRRADVPRSLGRRAVAAHPEVGWEQLRNVGMSQRSPLTALVKGKAKEAAAA